MNTQKGDAVIRDPLLGGFSKVNNHSLGEHSGYINATLITREKLNVPFKIKGERNPRGGWINLIREKDHAGNLELVYLDEEESKIAERKG